LLGRITGCLERCYPLALSDDDAAGFGDMPNGARKLAFFGHL
jgi:hypothetical protein